MMEDLLNKAYGTIDELLDTAPPEVKVKIITLLTNLAGDMPPQKYEVHVKGTHWDHKFAYEKQVSLSPEEEQEVIELIEKHKKAH